MTARPPWYRPRRYIHFDVPQSDKQVTEFLADKNNVERHSFYPLISFNVTSAGLKKSKTGSTFEKSAKTRRINYSAHLDAHIYSYYAYQLSTHYESRIHSEGLENCILAFRQLGKSNIDFALQAFQEIKSMGNCVVFAFDFKQFFDSLNHKYLKLQWANLLGEDKLPSDHYSVYKSLSRYACIDREELYKILGYSKTSVRKARLQRLCLPRIFRSVVRPSRLIIAYIKDYGIPQGTPISTILSNIYMLQFDAWALKLSNHLGGIYKRYCDDMLFILPSGINQHDFLHSINDQVSNIHLRLNDAKSEVCEFEELKPLAADKKPLQYLGFIFNGESILLRSSALARYSQRMKRGVRNAARGAKSVNAIRAKRGASDRKIFKKKLYARYSHHGRRNFVTYAYKAAAIMNSESIKRQIRTHWGRLRAEINKYDAP